MQFMTGRQSLSRIGLFPALLAVILLAFAASPRPEPALAQASDGPQATEIKLFVPWLPNGTLNPSVTVRGREMFTGNPNLASDCQSGSISTQRPDAWRCGTADPCFAPTLFSATEVACSIAPWDNDAVILMLSRPLPGPEQCRMTPTDCPRQLDLDSLPWAVELANGARCRAFTGTISEAAGLSLTHFCEGGGSMGIPSRDAPFDKTLPLWRAFYLPENGTVIEQVDVLVVWY
jgi:hypothetical protein